MKGHVSWLVSIRKELWRHGVRYRVAMRVLGTRPDLVFTKQRLVVFIDGCFWHGCPTHYTTPRSRRDFWASKLRQNFDRDRRQTDALSAAGWRVVRLWEHEATDRVAACAVIMEALAGHVPPGGMQLRRVVEVQLIDEAADSERRVLLDLTDTDFRQEVVAPRNTRGPSVRRPP